MSEFFGSATGLAIGFVVIIGDLYWLWLAIQLGSFLMFVTGLFPLFWLATAPLGAWSLFFGAPDWLITLFG